METCSDFNICFRPEDCWDGESGTSTCFIAVLIQFIFAVLLIAFSEIVPRHPDFFSFFTKFFQRKGRKEYDDTDKEDLARAFLNTNRSEENFYRANSDPKLVMPCKHNAEYDHRLSNGTIRSFYPVSGLVSSLLKLFDASIVSPVVILGSVGLGLFASSMSSLMFMGIQYERSCINHHLSEAMDVDLETWLDQVGSSASEISSNYKFYPVFLLVGYITFVVARWREFMVNCHIIQGRLHDTALLIGGAMKSPVSLEDRRKLFKIYRLLNLIHALCYHAISPTLQQLDYEEAYVNKLGLMTREEAAILLPTGNKARDGACALLVNESMLLLGSEGMDRNYVQTELSNLVCRIRAETTEHHGVYFLSFVCGGK